jgi:DNA-binding transcriptional MocR family regulator
MPAVRRLQVAEVIMRHGVLVVEDDVYTDLRYRGEPLPAFWCIAPDNTVYITSLSKTLAPALRIGITVLPESLLEPVLALKQGIDMQTSVFNQAIAAEFLDSPAAATHLVRIVESYAAKLDTVLRSLDKRFPAEFTWTEPDGGMFVWVEGPADFDADTLLRTALAAGVAFMPGAMFFAGADAPHSAMRLSFANVPGGEIDRGIDLLAALCDAARASSMSGR